MNEKTKAKFKVDIFKNCKGMWSFGICLSHHFEETYIYTSISLDGAFQ